MSQETVPLRRLAILSNRYGTLLTWESASDGGCNSMSRSTGKSALNGLGNSCHERTRTGADDGSCSVLDTEGTCIVSSATANVTCFVIGTEGSCAVPSAASNTSCSVIAATGNRSCSVSTQTPPPAHMSTHGQDGLRIFAPFPYSPFFCQHVAVVVGGCQRLFLFVVWEFISFDWMVRPMACS